MSSCATSRAGLLHGKLRPEAFSSEVETGSHQGKSAARYTDLGATPWPTSPAETKAFRDAEETRLLPIMKAAGIKPE
jgi:hypothetical protein